jgi:hypothetical protein
MARRGSRRGFWRGLFFGLLLGAAVLLVLAWLFPPLRAPDVESGALVVPAAPEAPETPAAAPRPLIEDLPGAPASTAAPRVAAPAAEPAPDLPAEGPPLVPPR